jgi:polyisoprenoid-binding protein YceI
MIKKCIVFAGLLFILLPVYAQKYYTSAATISFVSDAPVEKIESVNKQVTCLLNTATNDVAFKVIMKSFQFEKQGIYDHFNKDYVHSDKFPNASFQGKINGAVNYTKNGTYNVSVSGKLTIHGVTKEVTQNGSVTVTNEKITLKSKFSIQLSDYNVIVPNDFIKKISNKVDLSVDAVLTPYNR